MMAVRLELVGFRAGSAVLEMDASGGAIFEHALFTEAMSIFMNGSTRIVERAESLPPEFTLQVLDGLIRFTGGLSPRTIEYFDLDWRDTVSLRLDRGFREHARWLRRQRRRDLVTVVGRLHEGDFDPLALRCRVDTLDASVPCSFTEDMREPVLAAMDAMVVASGVAELQPDGRVRSLALDDITVVDESQRHTVGQLAHAQGVEPVRVISEFATFPEIDDEDFKRFVADAMSARS
ncbi:hypothetical protein [Goodfellowiella coeruleoviolacea]|uniref:Uncharacterized protein n=1 Tax=Goodfellowiella coeruleoviolacea TaxID=334858 RepID=A0AAE3GBV8_9PSEU|nr:hypothetical protein [Goodfellowiella coeruleoviolacea]MCP2164544.1 hypothetical protein [Goodfellowiella coeruleoviolacea]